MPWYGETSERAMRSLPFGKVTRVNNWKQQRHIRQSTIDESSVDASVFSQKGARMRATTPLKMATKPIRNRNVFYFCQIPIKYKFIENVCIFISASTMSETIVAANNNRQTMRVFTFEFCCCWCCWFCTSFHFVSFHICHKTSVQHTNVMSSCLYSVCTHTKMKWEKKSARTHSDNTMEQPFAVSPRERKLLLTILYINFIFHDFSRLVCVHVCVEVFS